MRDVQGLASEVRRGFKSDAPHTVVTSAQLALDLLVQEIDDLRAELDEYKRVWGE